MEHDFLKYVMLCYNLGCWESRVRHCMKLDLSFDCHLVVVVRLACLSDPKSCTGWGSSPWHHTGLVKG